MNSQARHHNEPEVPVARYLRFRTEPPASEKRAAHDGAAPEKLPRAALALRREGGREPVLRVQPYYGTPSVKAKPLKTGTRAHTTGQIVRRKPDKVSGHGAIIVDS